MPDPIIWLDAQLPPLLARWVRETFGWECRHIVDLRLPAPDVLIARAAAEAGAMLLTKDQDFRRIQLCPVLLLRVGNISNARLRDVLRRSLPDAVERLQRGEKLAEIHAG